MDVWEFMQSHTLGNSPKICSECGNEGARGLEGLCRTCWEDRFKRLNPPKPVTQEED